MRLVSVIERVERVAATRADAAAPPTAVKAGLADVHAVRAYLDACEADFARRVVTTSSFPEADLSEASRGSLNDSGKTLDRAKTLEDAPALADALDDGRVTAGHVDALTKASRSLDGERCAELFDRVEQLIAVAEEATVDQFRRRLRDEVNRLRADDGIDRLHRQIRDTTLSSWVGNDGMWNLRGSFDPVTGVKVAAKLESTVEALFAETTPETCPSDPVAKQRHLRALALARLIEHTVGGGRSGRPEFVAVIDIAAGPGTATSDEAGSGAVARPGGAGAVARPGGAGAVAGSGGRGGTGAPHVEWPIPIEVPSRVLAELIDDADVNVVVVRNGVVLHAPGELNLGRTTRLANRAQRRALRSLYRSCAIPGCTTGYDRCKLHHIIWWRHGGRTDLDNLIPVCSHHHHKIHDAGWNIALGANRELTVTFPDGTVRNTGPPNRRAA